MDDRKGLYAKLAAVQAEIGGLVADKHAKIVSPKANYSYDYTSESALGAAWRKHASPLGLAWFPAGCDDERHENVTKIRMQFHIVDAETGEIAMSSWTAYGVDYAADKALNKAQTTATRTFLSKMLLQGGEADPEQEHQADEPAKPKTKAAVVAEKLKSGEPVALDPHVEQRQILRGIVNDIRRLDETNGAVEWWDGLKPSGQRALSGEAIAKAIDRARPILAGLGELPVDPPMVDAETLAAFNEVAK